MKIIILLIILLRIGRCFASYERSFEEIMERELLKKNDILKNV